MQHRLLILLLVITSFTASSQDKFTISGYVKDASNGEELIGVTVLIKELSTGTITNHYGFYSITLAPGVYNLVLSYVGYQNYPVQIDLRANIEMNYELLTDATILQDIVVVGELEDEDVNIQGIRMSVNDLNIDQIKKLPSLFGEPDIIKNVQMQPGVISVGEGTHRLILQTLKRTFTCMQSLSIKVAVSQSQKSISYGQDLGLVQDLLIPM
ncbi:MAG: carboxypeptidase-like regulatory domain-containing protein [Bacteroidetes bacterium]|nr:carboxypeptidase-like regulatory domain-containing protein [Bacteroidota bacterium]MDA1120831.1 carboxypeptidase-like regulatory domain-containing protein [Bacteroidota bacterium]